MKEASRSIWKIYTDGASRGNPGPSGAGVYVTQDDIPIIKRGIYLGKKTNNQAEYLALALAIFFVKNSAAHRSIELPTLHLYADSELMVKQMKGIYRVKNPTLFQIKSQFLKTQEMSSYPYGKSPQISTPTEARL